MVIYKQVMKERQRIVAELKEHGYPADFIGKVLGVSPRQVGYIFAKAKADEEGNPCDNQTT